MKTQETALAGSVTREQPLPLDRLVAAPDAPTTPIPRGPDRMLERVWAGTPFARRLSWQLTASYTLVTVVVLVTLEALLFATVFLGIQFDRGIADPLALIGYGVIGLVILAVSGLVFTIATGVIGALFGIVTARPLTRRLTAVADMAAAWGSGDFSRLIDDRSEDELGQLARRLNAMASQFQDVIRRQGELSVASERNRLARDLHDSVKQQMFAVGMHLGAIQEIWEADPATARQRLDMVADLAHQSRKELTAIIGMLRPAQLEDKGLRQALTEYIDQWREQTRLTVNLAMTGVGDIPLPVEEALFRVAQEALANVARHSAAAAVWIDLAVGRDVVLQVRDDGHGFDPGLPAPGVGLASMRERIVAAGGRLDIVSGPGGTSIVARVLPREE